MVTLNGSTSNLMGLSTDDKPITDIDINTLFLELDTGDFYYFIGTEGSEWAKVGAAE